MKGDLQKREFLDLFETDLFNNIRGKKIESRTALLYFGYSTWTT